MADNENLTELYKKFHEWLAELSGVSGFNYYNYITKTLSSEKLNELWEYWYKHERPKETPIGDYFTYTQEQRQEGFGLDNKYLIQDVNTYKKRLADFFNQLVYAGVVSPESAQQSAQNAKQYIDLYKDGEISFFDLPFFTHLSRSDFPDWFKWYSGSLSDWQSAYEQGQQEWQRYEEDKEYREWAQRYKEKLERLQVEGDWANYRYIPETKQPTTISELRDLLASGRVISPDTDLEGMTAQQVSGKTDLPFYLDPTLLAQATKYQHGLLEHVVGSSYVPDLAEALKAYRRRYGKKSSWFQ